LGARHPACKSFEEDDKMRRDVRASSVRCALCAVAVAVAAKLESGFASREGRRGGGGSTYERKGGEE
jgi:hypothetical protein